MSLILRKDAVAGAFFTVVSLYFLSGSLQYEFGRLSNIGPANFPLGLSVILLAIGVVTLAKSVRSPELVNFAGSAVRPILLVVGALVFFSLAIERLGIVIAIFATVLVASRSDRLLPWNRSLLIAMVMTLLVVAIFRFGLRIYVPLWPW